MGGSAAAAAPVEEPGAADAVRPPRLPDAALALGLLAVTSLALLHHHHRSAAWWWWVLNAALVLPLAWRRRYPSGVFAVVAATALVQWFVGEPMLGDIALLIALYTVAAYEDRRRALVAAGVLEIGVVLASVRFSPARGILPSIVFLTGLLSGALFLGTTVRTRRAYLESLEDRALRLERERDSQARLAATEERTRIAREMHDIVAHSLSVMISLADGAALTTESDPGTARTAMQAVSGTGRTALAEMRRLLGVLRDDDSRPGEQRAPQPGLEQLEELIGSVRAAGLPVRFTNAGVPTALPPTRQTAVYRVVQEALTNVLKHGEEVTSVAVNMAWTSDALEIDVCDDGISQEGRTGAGHGLTGMRERVALHGGSIVAGPGRTRGWRVHAVLPLHEAAVEEAP